MPALSLDHYNIFCKDLDATVRRDLALRASVFYRSPAAVDFWKAIIGVQDLKSQLVRDISPVNNATKVKGAVFLYAGQDDIRVPIDQIIRMDKALKAAGNPAKAFVIKEKEGHGFGRLENNIDLYTQVLKFLDEQIGK